MAEAAQRLMTIRFRVPGFGLGLALLLVASLWLGCTAEPPPPIVLISIDTLRSDRLPIYGYDKVETPAIDALREDAILFERAYSPMPLTLPAHATMLTGLNPPGHGVRLNMGYRLESQDLPYLPRELADLGYRTGAAVSGYVVRSDTGLGANFEFFEDRIGREGSSAAQRSGPETLAAALPWLNSVADEPFFFLLHLYEPHSPFSPPEPYRSKYASAYDGEIAAADAVVGELVDELRSSGLYERATIVLTSDHGEGLGDHGEDEHGIFLYREALQVPLLIKLPSNERGGTSVSQPAQLADLLPTLLTLLERPIPSDLDGRSLLADEGAESEERFLYAETFYSRFYFGWSELFSVISDRYHYIHSPEPELFDLMADPAETTNLFASQGEIARRHRAELSSRDMTIQKPSDVDLETRQKLAALGYLGMGAVEIDGPLPAPQTQVHLQERIRTGLRSLEAGRDAEAASHFETALAENENLVFAWPLLARSLARLGRSDQALEAYERAIDLAGGASATALEAARLALRAGKQDRARDFARAALAVEPARAHRFLAQLALRNRDLLEARKQAVAAVEVDPGDPENLMLLARVERAGGDLGAALVRITEAEAALGSGARQTLFLLKGNVLAALDRPREAETALRREIEAFPKDFRAYARLAALQVKTGRSALAEATLREMIVVDGTADSWAAAVSTLRTLGEGALASKLLAEGRQHFPGSRDLSGLG